MPVPHDLGLLREIRLGVQLAPLRDFKIELVKRLISKASPDLYPARAAKTIDASSARRRDGEFPSLVDMESRTRCKVHAQRKECSTKREQCGAAMCATPCFKRYHTLAKPHYDDPDMQTSPLRVRDPHGRHSQTGRPRSLSGSKGSASGSGCKKSKLL